MASPGSQGLPFVFCVCFVSAWSGIDEMGGLEGISAQSEASGVAVLAATSIGATGRTEVN